MKSKICGAQIHTDYGPSYPEAYDHPAFIFYRAFKKKTWKHTFLSGANELEGLEIIFMNLNII